MNTSQWDSNSMNRETNNGEDRTPASATDASTSFWTKGRSWKGAIAIAGALAVASLAAGCNRTQEDHAADAASEAVHDTNQALHAVGAAAREGAREAGRVVDDAGITAKIKTALITDERVNGADINVDTSGGKVTLTGNLPDQEQVERALQIARGVQGVEAIENRLTVGAGTPARSS
jgi:osmotically-inducible protein OsmY